MRVGLFVDRIWAVDPVAETFMMECFLRLSWKDPRLAFVSLAKCSGLCTLAPSPR